MNRKLGINLNCYGPLPIEEQIAHMTENGVEATFTGSENPKLDTIIPALKAAGISCDNFHAPFDKINDIWKPGEAGDAMAQRLYDSVERCARYEVPALVVHLSAGMNPPYVNETGYERWAKLMALADEKGVAICYENQRMLSNLAFAFEQFKTARFCWDTGHESCFTPGRHYMPLFGQKLSALHIHDNHGVFNGDDHMIPFDAVIDFDYVAEQIALSGYTGTVMLELIRRKTTTYDDMTPGEYYRRGAEAARKLIHAIEVKTDKYTKGK